MYHQWYIKGILMSGSRYKKLNLTQSSNWVFKLNLHNLLFKAYENDWRGAWNNNKLSCKVFSILSCSFALQCKKAKIIWASLPVSPPKAWYGGCITFRTLPAVYNNFVNFFYEINFWSLTPIEGYFLPYNILQIQQCFVSCPTIVSPQRDTIR